MAHISSCQMLRWASFLSGAMGAECRAPEPPPARLPATPLLRGDEQLSSVLVSGPGVPLTKTHWMQRLLTVWGPVSEAAALERAAKAGAVASASHDIGEFTRDGTAADESTGGIARPSRLSPFLRWGVLSPRDAARLGVRRRDLLWRDWSHLCWTLLAPLRRGSPVIATLDGCLLRDCAPQATSPSLSRHQAHDTAETHPLAAKAEPRKCAALLGRLSQAEAFAAWCVGQTGAPLVDAGMRQLWVEGWMPRRVRLLCACCLTEGLGIDWRLGRDWMALTLVDHDYAINEMMWQNAGLVGVDPFYVSLKWEEHGEGEEAGEWAWEAYVQRWLTMDVRWPPHLREAAYRPRPPLDEVVASATARRQTLQHLYKAAGFVGRAGVRVDRRGDASGAVDASGSGEVLGVGRLSLVELSSKFFAGCSK